MAVPTGYAEAKLSDELLELADRLARSVHDAWAQQHRAGNGSPVPTPDAAQPEHVPAVPYEILSEVEKEHDRHIAREVIQAMLRLGYRIEPPGDDRAAGTTPGTDIGPDVTEALEFLEERATRDLASLLAFWQGRSLEVWKRAPQLYRLLGKRSLSLADPLMAYDVVTEGLTHYPADVPLRQLQAVALFKSGGGERAIRILQSLLQEGHDDEETLGNLAKWHKTLADMEEDPVERKLHRRRAAAAYLHAHERTEGIWTGINAATMSLLVDEKARAVRLARTVREQCLQKLAAKEASREEPYWELATLGEVALILGEWAEAEDWYARAAEVGRGKLEWLRTTRHNARLLLEHLGRDGTVMERCFRIPRVIVFAGHMIDRPDRSIPRFPPRLERAVRAEIGERLEQLDARLGYSSAACGSDILFLEALLERKGEAHVLLPYERETFRKDSVDITGDPRWGERFERVLQQAIKVQVPSEQKLPGGGVSYDYANSLLLGLASMKAAHLETDLVPLVVWDGRPGDGPGGTPTVVERWRRYGYSVQWINLHDIMQREAPDLTIGRDVLPPMPSRGSAGDDHGMTTQMMALLFADAEGFSKLNEAEVPRFVQHFLGAVADLAERYKPVVQNTWGDGLYFVFPGVREAGLFALDLCDLAAERDWAAKGLPDGLGLRIALHAGPVYCCVDSVTRTQTCAGTHVSRAARIEPVTPRNTVYGSEAFAALAAAERVREFACDYVGITQLAKHYGTFPMFHVRRR